MYCLHNLWGSQDAGKRGKGPVDNKPYYGQDRYQVSDGVSNNTAEIVVACRWLVGVLLLMTLVAVSPQRGSR